MAMNPDFVQATLLIFYCLVSICRDSNGMKEVLYDINSGVITGVLLVSMTVAAVVMPNKAFQPTGHKKPWPAAELVR